MKHMIQILSCSIIVCGLIVLSLVLVLWLRDGLHEIGVLLSIGKSKMEIIVQFILELVFISFPSEIILCAFSVMKHNTLCFILSYGLLMSILSICTNSESYDHDQKAKRNIIEIELGEK